jgi:hypothetical protein
MPLVTRYAARTGRAAYLALVVDVLRHRPASVDPLAGAGIGNVISVEGVISSALDSAMISERVSSRCPCSMRCPRRQGRNDGG